MEVRRREPAAQRRGNQRCAHGLTLVPGAGTAADAAAAARRSQVGWSGLPRGLSVETLDGAHALLYDRVRDGLEAYAQLTQAILQRVPCDPDLQVLVESSLHDGIAAARRVNAVIGRLLDAAAREPEPTLAGHQTTRQVGASAAVATG